MVLQITQLQTEQTVYLIGKTMYVASNKSTMLNKTIKKSKFVLEIDPNIIEKAMKSINVCY